MGRGASARGTELDGYRVVCQVGERSVHLASRNGLDWTAQLASGAPTAVTPPTPGTVIDGGFVVLLRYTEHGPSRATGSARRQGTR